MARFGAPHPNPSPRKRGEGPGAASTAATGKSIAIKFTPRVAGEIPFTCGMGMMKGKVIVK